MRYCSSGHANSDTAEFCALCGQQLLAAPAAPPPQAPPTPTTYGTPTYGTPVYGTPPPTPQPTNPWATPVAPAGWQTQQFSPPPRNSSRRWWIIGGIAVVAVALLGVLLLRGGGSGGGILAPDTETLTVTLDVYTDDFSGCDLGLGYFDVPGSLVIVEVDGEVVGTSELGNFGSDEGIYCQFTARVPNVPTDGALYEISVGRRGTGDVTKSELEANDWTYSATLGL